MLFRLKLFGSASIDGPTGPVTGRAVQRRRLGLLALLAVARDRGLTRDKLIGYLWPDADAERARHLLSDSVYRINQAVGGDGVIAVGDDLRLNPDRLPSDAWEFGVAIQRGDWERAAALHAAPFLDGFYLTDADELERWVDAQRERFARDRAHAIEELAEAAERADAMTDAVRWWRQLAAHDPYSSRIALRLMRALDRTGDRAAALQHARVHGVMLEEDLGLAPDADLLAFLADLRKSPESVPTTSRAGVGEPAVSKTPREPAVTPAGEAAPALNGATATAASDAQTSAAALSASGASPAATASPNAALDALPARQPMRVRRALAAAVILLAVVSGITAIARDRESAGTGPAMQAIAVLPFANLSADGEFDYFAAGMTEELIARLAHVEGIAVVGRTSVFAIDHQSLDIREIAARLNATAVMQGSVRHSGDRLRIVARLIDAANGYQLWTETYEREMADVIAIQDDIARQIVTRLRGGAEADASLSAPGATDDPEAFNLYLRGRYEWHQRTERSLRAAADYFTRAAARAPDYARAHAGLADAYAVLGFYDFLPPTEAFPAAAASARRALELQPSLGEPHATLGYVALYHDWDWPRADRSFRRAIELEPAYSTAQQWYGNYLTAMGRFDEAIAAMTSAMELDPLSVIANAALGWVYYHSGDDVRAVAQFTHTLELNPDFALAHLWRAQSYEASGDIDAALDDFEQALRLAGTSAGYVALHARALALAGQPDRARALLRELTAREDTAYVPPYELAKVHAALGDTDAALRALESAFEHRSHSIAFLAVDRQLATLHHDPRFRDLVQRAGLADTPGGERLHD